MEVGIDSVTAIPDTIVYFGLSGKALTGLEKGTGLVLVLVTLQ